MSSLSKYEILDQYGVIQATGEDAISFLHAQLTQDIQSLAVGQSRLAAYCNAKGRMQATLIVSRSDNGDVYLLTHRDMTAQLCKRLSMFVLRSKCKLHDVSDSVTALSLLGPTIELGNSLIQSQWPSLIENNQRLVLIPSPQLENVKHTLEQSGFTQQPHSEQLQFEQGVAQVTPSTFEAFIPQMVNLDLVGGVNFQKGCYPGQEVVARSHYLGKQKRRMQKGTAPVPVTDLKPGMDIYLSDQTHEPAGLLIQCRSLDAANSEVLFEVPLDRLLDGVQIRLGQADGVQIERTLLPYDIPVKA